MQTVLITGGAGSLAEGLIKELLTTDVKSIRALDNSEYALYQLGHIIQDKRVRFLLGDVRDYRRLLRAMEGVEVVFHTAAYKHVDLCEYNPIDAVKTNVIGMTNVVDAALDCHVKKVLTISSDKAVHPVNLYGATKLVAEKIAVESNVYGDTAFSCIRFGNFYGSRGSFIPLLMQQKEGGEVTVTDKEMTRYWIDIPEAAKFCIRCVDMMRGGEVYVPKMPNRKIIEIVEAIAPLAKVKIIGKKPGEKLHELLWSEEEVAEEHDGYWVVKGG